ncbi:aspartate ammonia-lyase [Cupriavidus sp. WGtm5]|uniref:aspartate ammonia-lyase n=1 Tax=Cupriavidus sp. WGtm5 TaxID=2919926 RepID=UPI002090E6D6|nr:aspartate ammonia-lyase [Cupriavidus sp. WGtm5]MCO4892721.1 aspartate ammonia-lyase [Cupriavidus sp. WGtm5]
MTTATPTRQEQDLLGTRDLDHNLYYGVQTLRAKENFYLSGRCIGEYPDFIKALAIVKHAAANANHRLGLLDSARHGAITKACAEVIDGAFHDAFVVDMIQGGAGTSTNMNANEVLANRALEHLGEQKGSYGRLHPNNDVNLSQSTNDAYPTAIRVGLLLAHLPLLESLCHLAATLANKAQQFGGILKMGRTQLQDAVPMTLGQEFQAMADIVSADLEQMRTLIPATLCAVNLGGTAIGTGINADPRYQAIAIEELAALSGFPVRAASNLIAATSDMGDFVLLSGLVKRTALRLSKISNDLRLLSSGPRTGIAEINLPARQPGSSIMPGKVNPVIPEAMNQVAYEIAGNDAALTLAAEAGQLQLNAMEPLIAYKLYDSIRLLSRAVRMLDRECIEGISANPDQCSALVHRSIGVVTALNPYIGYENATRIARLAQETGRTVVELVQSEQLLSNALLAEILRPENMVAPRSPLTR